MVDLILEEEEDAPDTSRDEEIARKLFNDLNHGLLGPPSDDSIIVLSNSEEEEGVREDDRTNAKVMPSSTRNSPAPSAATDDNAPDEVQDDSSGSGTSDWVQNDSSDDKPTRYQMRGNPIGFSDNEPIVA
jgi:hypothetical protein